MQGTPGRRIVQGILTLLIALGILFPVAWMSIAAFKGKTEVLRSPFLDEAVRALGLSPAEEKECTASLSPVPALVPTSICA